MQQGVLSTKMSPLVANFEKKQCNKIRQLSLALCRLGQADNNTMVVNAPRVYIQSLRYPEPLVTGHRSLKFQFDMACFSGRTFKPLEVLSKESHVSQLQKYKVNSED